MKLAAGHSELEGHLVQRSRMYEEHILHLLLRAMFRPSVKTSKTIKAHERLRTKEFIRFLLDALSRNSSLPFVLRLSNSRLWPASP